VAELMAVDWKLVESVQERLGKRREETIKGFLPPEKPNYDKGEWVVFDICPGEDPKLEEEDDMESDRLLAMMSLYPIIGSLFDMPRN
jgi:hypothetical protein